MDLYNIEEMKNYDNGKELIYLATAYTPVFFGFCLNGPVSQFLGRLIQRHRFRRVNKAAANLILMGLNVFSPISHSHPIPINKLDVKVWLPMDFWFVRRADVIYILNQYGWDLSHGVGIEIEWGKKLGKPTYLIDIAGKILKRIN